MTLESQAHFHDYSPVSVGWGGDSDPEAHPELLVPFTHSGVSFGSMHRDAVGVFTQFLDQLVPLIPSKRLVAGTCGCFNPRSVTQSGRRSFHTFGVAIDINWAANPMGPAGMSRPTNQDALPAATHDLAHALGLEWGGDFHDFKDWMHVECHLSPAVARTVTASTQPNTGDDMFEASDKKMLTDLHDRLGKIDVLAFNIDGGAGAEGLRTVIGAMRAEIQALHAEVDAIRTKVGA